MINKRKEKKLAKNFSFYNKLKPEKRENLLNQLTYIKYPPGKIIMKAGYTCENTFFLLKGSIRVYKVSEKGRELTLYRIQRGEMCLMSIACIMSSSNFPAQAQIEKETEILALPASTFKRYLSSIPELQEFVFGKVFSRLQDVMLTVEDIAFKNIETRIASFLISTVEQNQETLNLTQAEIAKEIGSAREVVSRTLRDFAARGAVELGRGKITIIKQRFLEDLAYR